MILALIAEASTNGARQSKACETLGVSARMLQRWRQRGGGDQRCGPSTKPSSSLSEQERRRVVDIATSPEFRGVSPKQIVPALADRGEFVASESSFYRVLRDDALSSHRGRQRPPSKRPPREHRATGPWQLASWDITYLKTTVSGMYYYLYLFMDVWSRKIIGWRVHETESAELSSALVKEICSGAPQEFDLEGWVLHSDNGGPMKGATMLATLERLGVLPSFSRPRVSDDNPFSESLFKTLKYVPEYPRIFNSVVHAEQWVEAFVTWYNEEHLHSAIGYVTPSSRHAGTDVDIIRQRCETYEKARAKNPSRWSGKTRSWKRPAAVYLNPGKGKTASRHDPTAAVRRKFDSQTTQDPTEVSGGVGI